MQSVTCHRLKRISEEIHFIFHSLRSITSNTLTSKKILLSMPAYLCTKNMI
jgi:hypothetical protein